MKRGIDVSEHNGTINWQDVVNDGNEFAIIRLGWEISTWMKGSMIISMAP